MKIIVDCCHGVFPNTLKKLKRLKTCFKTLLWKCSFGPIKSKFDNDAGNFPLKLQVPLLEIKFFYWKIICVRKNLPKFFLCTPNLWFCHPWLPFHAEQKKTHKVLNRAQNVKFTFIIFISKCCTGHLKFAFDNPEKSFSPENRCFRSMTENFHSNSFASITKFLKMVICTGRLRFWESCLTVLLIVQVFSPQSPKLIKETNFPG